MQKRICPNCFTRWYSSERVTIWECESCGHDIPVPKVALEEVRNKRRNILE